MRTATSVVVTAVLLSLTVTSLFAKGEPNGWVLAGKEPASYVVDIDNSQAHSGKSCALYASVGEPKGFGTIMQYFDPVDYRGKRLQLSGFVKSKDVKSWAGMWMRVDGPVQGQSLAFDNMANRPIKGTNDWTRYSIVLDIPESATNLSFGVLLDGQGKLWMDDLQFQIVDNAVPTTDTLPQTKKAPENLDFEH
jgi:hypothetical protein